MKHCIILLFLFLSLEGMGQDQEYWLHKADSLERVVDSIDFDMAIRQKLRDSYAAGAKIARQLAGSNITEVTGQPGSLPDSIKPKKKLRKKQ